MSARLFQRVIKERESDISAVAEEEEESDSPPAASPARNPFELLGDDDNNEEEEEESSADKIEESKPQIKTQLITNPSNKNKSKKKKKKTKTEQSKKQQEDTSSLDSILQDLSLTPSTKPSTDLDAKSKKEKEPSASRSVLAIDPKHLKAENELKKIFGSKVVKSFENQAGTSGAGTRRGFQNPRFQNPRFQNPRKTLLVSPKPYWPKWDGSLSMELVEIKNGIHYFRYVHSESYKHYQEIFEHAKSANDINSIAHILHQFPYHLDSLLTFSDLFKYSGDHQSSSDAIAKILFALESAWHPSFTPLLCNCQVQFVHETNKPFFKALFSHMRQMDRRGCHRSALEVCKLLLSLDSDDPMGAIFCIDYFAIRAQEYTWLEKFSEEYYNKGDTSLWLFPNFSFSLPIARFYSEKDENSTDLNARSKSSGTDLDARITERSGSSELMKQALMLHPSVLRKIADKAPLKEIAWAEILRNVFFGFAKPGGPTLEHLIEIYVERSYVVWRIPEVQGLLKHAALQVMELVNKGNGSEVADWVCVRKEAFNSDKNEYSHLMVSDFSDTIPTIPPEELRPLMMGGPEMGQMGQDNIQLPAVEQDMIPDILRVVPRNLEGRNPWNVFLESILPWNDFGVLERDGLNDDGDDNEEENH